MTFKINNYMVLVCLLCSWTQALALESDRQKPLEVNANSTQGTLGDGITVLRGNVIIRQGSLLIIADNAEVDKLDGKVQLVTFRGKPAHMEQEIEEQGLVKAFAETITYRVGEGLVNLKGDAKVNHPQYQIDGDDLTYDLNKQHFQGTGAANGNGRIRIRMDPAVVPDTILVPGVEDDSGDADEAEGA